jgi:selenide,water dikinase
MKRLLLLGGGHAHVHVLREIGAALDPLVSVTLVSPCPRLLYTGMVPGYVAGHYSAEEVSIDLVALAARARARLVPGTAVSVDPDRRAVTCADGSTFDYDVLSCDIGSQLRTAGVPGAQAHAFPVRPMEKLLEGWSRVLEDARRRVVRAVTIVGGGAAGVELAFAMDWRLRRELGDDLSHVRVLTDTPSPLPEFNAGARRLLVSRLQARGIGVHAGIPVAEVGEGFVRLANGNEFASDATFWAGGAAAPGLFRASGLATDERGFLAVDAALRSTSHPGVFGAGDCASVVGEPRAKAGVFAVRAAVPLAANLRAALAASGAYVGWRPQRRFLALVSTGDRHAVGSWGPLAFQGRWAWRWKDRIDREFVARFSP